MTFIFLNTNVRYRIFVRLHNSVVRKVHDTPYRPSHDLNNSLRETLFFVFTRSVLFGCLQPLCSAFVVSPKYLTSDVIA